MFGGSANDDDKLEKLKSTASSNAPPVLAPVKRDPIPSPRTDIDLTDSTTVSVSPTRNLPREIIGEILASCIPSAVGIMAGFEAQSPPWNLTQICSVWRGVALGLPTLWNDIMVEFDCGRPMECTRLAVVLKTFLSRTGNATISLDIFAVSDHNPFCQPFTESIIALVQPYVGRLRNLVLEPAEVFMPILKLPSGRVDALESVSLAFAREDGDSSNSFTSGDGLTDNITSFDSAGNLRRLTLTFQHADVHLTAFLFPWSQLTQLMILEANVDFVHGHAVLRQCTSLVSCDISMTINDNCNAAETVPPTLLPNLVSLTVRAYAEEELHGLFLQPFILPSLRRLKLFADDDAIWSGMDVTNLIKRSQLAKLDHLKFDSLRPQDQSAILAGLPAVVEELSLCFSTLQYYSDDSESLIAELVTAIARGDLASNIERFKLDDVEDMWWMSFRSQAPNVTIRCRPEEMQPAFRDFWLGLRSADSENLKTVVVTIQDSSGNLLGVNGRVQH